MAGIVNGVADCVTNKTHSKIIRIYYSGYLLLHLFYLENIASFSIAFSFCL
jgi:hypothetical protein